MSYTTPYCDTEWAEQYFSERSNSDNWNDATDEEKLAALCTATRDIYHHAYFSELVETGEDESDLVQFRYKYDGTETRVIPDHLKEATCEQAIYKMTLNRLDALDATRSGISSAKGVVFDKEAIPNILCDECIDLLNEMGAEVDPGAGGPGPVVQRIERIER